MAERIYVLKLEGGRYYIGKTTNLTETFEKHKQGLHSSEWTRRYAPIRVERTFGDCNIDDVVKEYMKQYGIHYVRGGTFGIELTPEQEKSLLSELFPPQIDIVDVARTTVSNVLNTVGSFFTTASEIVKPKTL